MAVPYTEAAAGQLEDSDAQVCLPDERILSGDCSAFRLILVNEHFLELFHTVGIRRYNIIGHRTDIEIGDIYLLETYRAEDLYDVFEDCPELARSWRKLLMIIKLGDTVAAAWTRLFAAPPLPDPDIETETVSLSGEATESLESGTAPTTGIETMPAALDAALRNLHGYTFLPPVIQANVRAYISQVTNDDLRDSVEKARAAGELEKVIGELELAQERLLSVSRSGTSATDKPERSSSLLTSVLQVEALPPPRRRRRKLYEQELEDIFRKDPRVTADQLPSGWSRPTKAAIERCLDAIERSGFDLMSLMNALEENEEEEDVDTEEA